MKQILMISLLMAAVANASYGQNEIEGYWLAGEGNTIVEFTELENGTYQGKIVWLKKTTDKKGNPFKDTKNPDKSLRNRDILGLPMVERADYENGAWKGQIYAVKNGRTVNATFTLDGDDKLKVKVSFRGFKRTQVWTKTDLPK